MVESVTTILTATNVVHQLRLSLEAIPLSHCSILQTTLRSSLRMSINAASGLMGGFLILHAHTYVNCDTTATFS